jgi:histone-lysine N-methyltransferase SETD2
MAAAADAAEEAERAAGGGPSGGAAAAAAAAAAAPRPAGRARRRPAVWQLTAANMYLHRERRRQDEDDVMICQCKTIWATDTTSVGCGEACLNRMLNIECVAEHCPSGARCSNQAFTRREAAPLAVRRAGAKGFGLFTAGPLRAGQFIIEYVGEVLEEDEYARRREFYAGTGQRHYYFMNVGNGEVIDATRKGGEGRFINHSCAPNCETQKWVVRGELAIGLFALEDVPAGAELTFDYNFERYGDKPMKCLCGAPGCRGMIGGTQETAASAAAAVVTPDSDEEEPEPIMVTAKESDAAVAAILDREVGLGWERGWEPKLSKRLEKLAAAKGVDLGGGGGGGGGHSEDDEEAAAAATAAVEAVASGRKAGRAPRRPAAPKPRRRDEDWKDAGAAAEATRAQRGAEEASAALASPRGGGGAAAAAAEPSAALIPKRAPSLGGAAGPRGAARRRSEVDRRLESMVGPSGRLRDAAPASVMRLLRLFNLCDIGPTVARAEGAAGRAASGSRGSAGEREDGEASPLREGGGPKVAAGAS